MVNLVHHLGVGQALGLRGLSLLAGAAAVKPAAVRAVVARGVLLPLPAIGMADESHANGVVPAVMAQAAVVVRVVPDGDTGGSGNAEVLAVDAEHIHLITLPNGR